jgi:hypothetical protein
MPGYILVTFFHRSIIIWRTARTSKRNTRLTWYVRGLWGLQHATSIFHNLFELHNGLFISLKLESDRTRFKHSNCLCFADLPPPGSSKAIIQSVAKQRNNGVRSVFESSCMSAICEKEKAKRVSETQWIQLKDSHQIHVPRLWISAEIDLSKPNEATIQYKRGRWSASWYNYWWKATKKLLSSFSVVLVHHQCCHHLAGLNKTMAAMTTPSRRHLRWCSI